MRLKKENSPQGKNTMRNNSYEHRVLNLCNACKFASGGIMQ